MAKDGKEGKLMSMRDVHEPRDYKLDVLHEIRKLLVEIKYQREWPFFFPLRDPDGTTHFVNLQQATEIELRSEEECYIKFASGEAIAITTREKVDAVLQAIQEKFVLTVDPSKALPQQAQTK